MPQGKKHEPTPETRRQVRSLVAMGTPHKAVAKIVGISAPTLRRHYREELDLAHQEANAQVAGALYKLATNPGPQQVTAAIFWLKCRARWRDRDPVQAHVHATADNSALLELVSRADEYQPTEADLEWQRRQSADPADN